MEPTVQENSASGRRPCGAQDTQASLGLDVGKMAKAQRWPGLLRAFDALEPGEHLIVVEVKDSRLLLRQLQLDRPAEFEWNVLAELNKCSRIEIRKRAGSLLRNVTEYFEADHQRLNSILVGVVDAVRTDCLDEASERSAEFNCGIHRHINAEESVLFPLMEKAYGLAIGPKTVMGAEHCDIRRLTDSMSTTLETRNIDAFLKTAIDLSEVLVRHDMKEERILYPMVDKSLGDEQLRHELVSQMQAL